MKSTNHPTKNHNQSHSMSEKQLQHQLQAIRVRDARGKQALRLTLQNLNEDQLIETAEPAKKKFSFFPAMATGLAALVLVVFGAGWVLNQNSSSTDSVVTSQTQANGTVQNVANAQLQDAQDDSSLANDDTAQINTANARLQSVSKVGESIDENQF